LNFDFDWVAPSTTFHYLQNHQNYWSGGDADYGINEDGDDDGFSDQATQGTDFDEIDEEFWGTGSDGDSDGDGDGDGDDEGLGLGIENGIDDGG
jgi:hypothetical protein